MKKVTIYYYVRCSYNFLFKFKSCFNLTNIFIYLTWKLEKDFNFYNLSTEVVFKLMLLFLIKINFCDRFPKCFMLKIHPNLMYQLFR